MPIRLSVGRLLTHGLHQTAPPPPPPHGLLPHLYPSVAESAACRLLPPLPLAARLAPSSSALEEALRRGLTRLHAQPSPSPPGRRDSPPLMSLRNMIDDATAGHIGGAAVCGLGGAAGARSEDCSQEEIDVVDADML